MMELEGISGGGLCGIRTYIKVFRNQGLTRIFTSFRISAAGSPLRLRSGSRLLIGLNFQRALKWVWGGFAGRFTDGHTLRCPNQEISFAQGWVDVCDGGHWGFVMKEGPGLQRKDA